MLNILIEIERQITLGRVLFSGDRVLGMDRKITVGQYRTAVPDPAQAFALYIDQEPRFFGSAYMAARAFVGLIGEREARSSWSKAVLRDFGAPDPESQARTKPKPPARTECSHLAVELQRPERRTSRNRLRVDAMETGIPRCLLKKPDHWPASASAINWIGSGGSAFVFGHCFGPTSPSCPRSKDQN